MNRELYNKSKERPYRIPQHIVEKIRAKLATVNGVTNGTKRGKWIVNNGICTYAMLKRLKNFFDYANPAVQKDEYELAGGKDMKDFVERTLGAERNLVASKKNTNVMFMPQLDNRTLHAQGGAVNLGITEEFEGLQKNGLAVIFSRGDGDEKVLLVKRNPDDHWEPNKWALVGGKIEAGETPEEGTKREIWEEAGLQITDFIGDFVIRTSEDSVEYVFVTSVEGQPAVVINEEHTEYAWFSTDQIRDLDKTPHLDDFIALAKQKLIVWSVDNDDTLNQ